MMFRLIVIFCLLSTGTIYGQEKSGQDNSTTDEGSITKVIDQTLSKTVDKTVEGTQVLTESMRLAFLDIWNFPIVTVDKNTITVSTIITGLFFLVLGVFISKFLSRRIAKRIFVKLNLDRGVQHTFERLTFYILAVIFTLFAMKLANLPITLFTVLGGALAIGIGFGSQNAVNNFISGLILMVERPVKVGDFIEVDGLFGEVVDIGMRSTHIRGFGNRIFIVPNSGFLEKNVINWTLHSDNYARFNIKVGIVYGGDTRLARDLMLQAAAEEPRVVTTGIRTPDVYFMDFGDNALMLELNCWVKLEQLNDFKEVQSNLRFKIDDLFRQANLVIAFPQRDIHLYPQKPIEVQLMKPDPVSG